MFKIIDLITNILFERICLTCIRESNLKPICNSCENEYVERRNYCRELKNIVVFSWGMYDGKLREAILKFKTGKKELSKYFSYKLLNFWKQINPAIRDIEYLVLPVPSHKKRKAERGYCQSTILANEFAKEVKKNFSADLVIRVKNTQHMNKLNNIKERTENIKDAFKITNGNLKEKYILIIDDILTSGCTLQELAKTITDIYPEKIIYGLTIASGDTYFL